MAQPQRRLSPPSRGWDVCVCLPRWPLGSLQTLSSGAGLPSPPRTFSSLPLPPPSSLHPLLSTFNLLGIIDSVFFLHLIFRSLLFITFKPLLDKSRPQCLQGEEAVGGHCQLLWADRWFSCGTGTHCFCLPILPTHTGDLLALTPVFRKHLKHKRLMNSWRRE